VGHPKLVKLLSSTTTSNKAKVGLTLTDFSVLVTGTVGRWWNSTPKSVSAPYLWCWLQCRMGK